jgi:hypothetical protein
LALIKIGKKLVDPEQQLIDIERADCEDSLYLFLRHAWKFIDPSPWRDGWPIEAVAEHLQPERLYQYVVSLRASKGIKIIPIDSFLRPIFRALRNNELVGLAADRNLTGTGTLIDFFGAPALLPDGSYERVKAKGERPPISSQAWLIGHRAAQPTEAEM